jgi:hypothetical protein
VLLVGAGPRVHLHSNKPVDAANHRTDGLCEKTAASRAAGWRWARYTPAQQHAAYSMPSTQCEQRGTTLKAHERSQQRAMLAASCAGGWRWARCKPAQQHAGEAVRYYTDLSGVKPTGRAVVADCRAARCAPAQQHAAYRHPVLFGLACAKPAASNASSKPWCWLVLGQGYTLYSNAQHTAFLRIRCNREVLSHAP